MRLLSWNCRGLGNPRTVHDLNLMVKVHKPTILFLMETRLHKNRMEKLRYLFGFPNMLTMKGWGIGVGYNILRHLHSFNLKMWLCIGDFNEILFQSDKEGGAPRPVKQMALFKDGKYTWSNNRTDSSFTKEKLDRARPSQFEARWATFEDYGEAIHSSWLQASGVSGDLASLSSKLASCMQFFADGPLPNLQFLINFYRKSCLY
ncbi:hypothetical protein I3760_Q012700 [Carya illinoinensis]|nr:hypothetical protein I3760_Q012700 [Carya illinoinensis]